MRGMYQKTARRLALCGALLLAACASPFHRAEELALRAEWLKAVIEYRKAVAENPRNVEARSRLKQAEMQAAEHFYARGLQQIAAGNLDGAITQFQQGLVAMPENGKLLQAMNEAVARKEADLEFEEGKRLQASDKKSDALAKFKRALELYPAHAPATAALAELKTEQDKSADGFVLKSREPIALNFRQTDMKQAFDFLAKAFGINIIFDEGVRGAPVTLYAKRVTFEQGLNLILNTTKTFYKRIGPNTLLIAADSKEKRGQYEDHLVRTFQLNTISAKEMADILKGVVTFKKLIVNERLNSIVVRDTAELITLAEKIIDSNDRKPAELLLEVEILEVNRTTAEKLGLDLGAYEISARTPSFPATARVRDAIRAATITIPSVALRFFKQDVDAKTLANPKVRVLSGKSAKIHIGDRVPLRSATIQDATGQVRTTYDYRDIGIRLGAEPIVHLDNSTTVKLMLEVSALGENLGTPNDPAFRIGTRNAETLMLLRDGETAILGGLIRDEERNTRARIPGLGSIPAVGSAFTSYDDSGGRTDVLLTITPRVVRGWDVQTKTTREFYSGSETVYTVKPLFPEIDGGADVQMQSDAAPATGAPAAQTGNASPQAAVPAAPAKAILPADAPFLAFGETAYEVAVGQEINIKLVGGGLGGVVNMAADVLYSPQVLSFVRSERGDAELTSLQAQADGQRGAVQLAMQSAKPMAASGPSTLARLVFTASKPGISYVVYRVTGLKTASGEPVEPQLRASRVVVK